MPSQQKGGGLSEFQRTVYRATSPRDRLFSREFETCCRNVDRHGMIKMLIKLEPVEKLKIQESYRAKSNAEAEKTLAVISPGCVNNVDEKPGESEGDIRLKIRFLTKALFAADTKSWLFGEILLERARCWHRIGALSRCVRDCDCLTAAIMTGREIEATRRSTGDEEISGKNTDIAMRVSRMSECVIGLKEKCAAAAAAAPPPKRSSNIMLMANRWQSAAAPAAPPAVDGRPNPKLKSCSDAVTLRYDKTIGRHLVAARNIKAGSVLIVDRAFAFSTDNDALPTNCLHCHASLDLEENTRLPCYNCQSVAFCSDSCRRDSWDNYHKYECTIFDYFYETDSINRHRSHLLLAWRTTITGAIDRSTDTLREQFLRLHADTSAAAESQDDGIDRRGIHETVDDSYDSLDYTTVMALETHCSEATTCSNLRRSLVAVFFAKCLVAVLSKLGARRGIEAESIDTQGNIVSIAVAMLRHLQAVDCNAYEIVENSRDDETKIWEPRNVGGAIYPTVSLVNHGCYPNVVRHSYPGGKVVVRALRFIAKGCQVLDCYGPHFVSECCCSSRRRYLQDKYHFRCACEACSNDWQLSDDRLLAYKCPWCGNSVPAGQHQTRCSGCSRTIDMKKLQAQLAKSVKKRIRAIARMLSGNYAEALPYLVEHATLIDKILAVPSLEAIKTQQSIVQCYNSLASTRPFARPS